MKVGITINDFYKEYLQSIAKENGMSITRICSLICMNFLSYNKLKHKTPVFTPMVKLTLVSSETPSVSSPEAMKQASDIDEESFDEYCEKFDSPTPGGPSQLGDEEMPF